MTTITVGHSIVCERRVVLRRRWPIASKILLTLAVLLGALSFVMIRGYQQRADALRPASGNETPVVIAMVDLARGTVLSEADVGSTSVPAAFVPPGALQDPSDATGRVLTAGIVAGEIVTESRLAAPGAGPIAALVPPGLRAIVISAGLPQGSVRAGDRIDVFATYGGGRPHTELAADAIEVLKVLTSAEGSSSLGGSAAGSADAGAALVVLADTDAAERLAYARAYAQLTVAILGPDPATGSP